MTHTSTRLAVLAILVMVGAGCQPGGVIPQEMAKPIEEPQKQSLPKSLRIVENVIYPPIDLSVPRSNDAQVKAIIEAQRYELQIIDSEGTPVSNASIVVGDPSRVSGAAISDGEGMVKISCCVGEVIHVYSQKIYEHARISSYDLSKDFVNQVVIEEVPIYLPTAEP